MLPASWASDRLSFSRFEPSECSDMKSVFEANAALHDLDPTFKRYPDKEYQELIENDQTGAADTGESTFFIRKIRDETKATVGYLQLEIHAPRRGVCWIPMLVFDPKVSARGYGRESMASIEEVVSTLGNVTEMMLNVYAQNTNAFRFWYRNGFDEICAWTRERDADRDYDCLVLRKRLLRT